MFIAREKRKTNIAEYVIYMWQVEDLLRGFNFNIENLYTSVFSQHGYSSSYESEIRDWYENIAEMMALEKVQKIGHIQVVKNIVNEMTDLHFKLLHEYKDNKYIEIVYSAANNLVEFRKNNSITNDISDIELCLTAMYGILMLRLQSKDISKETVVAASSFSKILAYISNKYIEIETRDIEQE